MLCDAELKLRRFHLLRNFKALIRHVSCGRGDQKSSLPSRHTGTTLVLALDGGKDDGVSRLAVRFLLLNLRAVTAVLLLRGTFLGIEMHVYVCSVC